MVGAAVGVGVLDLNPKPLQAVKPVNSNNKEIMENILSFIHCPNQLQDNARNPVLQAAIL
jgi:hypothetical protein